MMSSKLHILVISAADLAKQVKPATLPEYSEGSLFVISENDQVGLKTGNLISIMSDDKVNTTRVQFKCSPMSFDQVSAGEVAALHEYFDVKTVSNLSEGMRRLAEDRQLAGRDMQAVRHGAGRGASGAAIA